MHAPCWTSPALALSTLTCMRPIQSHPETFCVGVSDSGDSGRIHCSGRINNVYLFLPFSVLSLSTFTNHPPSALDSLFLMHSTVTLATSQQKVIALVTVRPRSAKRPVACVMSVWLRRFSCILVLAPVEGWRVCVLDRVFLA